MFDKPDFEGVLGLPRINADLASPLSGPFPRATIKQHILKQMEATLLMHSKFEEENTFMVLPVWTEVTSI